MSNIVWKLVEFYLNVFKYEPKTVTYTDINQLNKNYALNATQKENLIKICY